MPFRWGRGWARLAPRWLNRPAPAVLSKPESVATLVSLAITGTQTISTYHGTTQFTATGTYSDSSTADITTLCSWTSGTTSVATVGAATGLCTQVFTGSSVITATLGAVSNTRTVTCSPRIPQTAAELAVACGGYGTWTWAIDFQEASGTTAAPLFGTGNVTCGSSVTRDASGLTAPSGDKSISSPTFSWPDSESFADSGIAEATTSEDFAVIQIGTGAPGFGRAGGDFGVAGGQSGGNPMVVGFWGGASYMYGSSQVVTDGTYSHGTTWRAILLAGERGAVQLATIALATPNASGKLASPIAITGASIPVGNGTIGTWDGAGKTTFIAVARGSGACAGMVAAAQTIVESFRTYVGGLT